MRPIESDTLSFRLHMEDNPLTRRGMLSAISSIHDVSGVASSCLPKGRKVLQGVTADKKSWDDPISNEHRVKWEEWREDIHLLNTITIPRCFKSCTFGKSVDSSIHNFSDANSIGYGDRSYLRQINREGNIEVALIMVKSRISPLKPVTIIRLELNAASLSVDVGGTIKRELEIEGLKEVYWADSMVALGYIVNDTRIFKIYVDNRAKKIRNITSVEQ